MGGARSRAGPGGAWLGRSPVPRRVEEGRECERSMGALVRKGGAVPVGGALGRAAPRGRCATLQSAWGY